MEASAMTKNYGSRLKIAVVEKRNSRQCRRSSISPQARITVFEANDYIGGRSNTLDVSSDGEN